MKKLHLDALVIQQGRLAEKEKNMSKDELMSAIRYGADDVFKDDGGEDEDGPPEQHPLRQVRQPRRHRRRRPAHVLRQGRPTH